MKLPAILFVTTALLLAACSTTQQAALNAWLASPTTQAELADMQSFAFEILMAYLESNVSAAAAPNFAPIEPAAIAKVQAKFGLTTAEATYVVRQAESRIAASVHAVHRVH